MQAIYIQPISEQNRHWIATLARCHFASETVIVYGDIFYPAKEPGFIAHIDEKGVGAVTLARKGKVCEIVLLDALESREDIFRALLKAAANWAVDQGCKRMVVTTTNDNTDALRIYQQNGFRLKELRINAIAASRKLKPEIPMVGDEGIPIRDEIEPELVL